MESKNNTNGHPEDTSAAIPPAPPEEKENHSPTSGRTANNELNDNENPHNRWMTRFTAVIAFAAIVQGIIGYLQWTTMNNTLREIREGGRDTHELAVSAQAQTVSTKAVADGTLAHVKATNKLAREAKRSADISDNTLRNTQELAILDKRPWVGFDFIDNTTKSEGYLKHRLIGSLSNTGKTPSINLEGEAFLILRYRYNSGGLDVSSIHKEINKKDGRLLPTPGPIRIDKFNENEIIGLDDIGYVKVVPPNSKREFPVLQDVEFKLGGRVNNDLYNPAMIYIVGEVSYYDTSRTKKFITEFCIEKEFGADHSRFRPCPFGNDMK